MVVLDRRELAGTRPAVSEADDLERILRRDGVLKTGRLVKHWYVLSNDNITVLVDTIRPRIASVLLHGLFGAPNQLTYDTHEEELARGGCFIGIVPCLHQAGRRYLPFRHSVQFSAEGLSRFPNPPEEVVFDGENRTVELRGIRCFVDDPKTVDSVQGLSFKVSLQDTGLTVEVVYPESAWEGELTSFWYPLYTALESRGVRRALGYYDGFTAVCAPPVTLSDGEGRLPAFTISSENTSAAIESSAEKDRAQAFRLVVRNRGMAAGDRISFSWRPPAVSLRVNPLIETEKHETVIVAHRKPAVTVNGEHVPVRRTKDGYSFSRRFPAGVSVITACDGAARSRQRVLAAGPAKDKLLSTAQALLAIQWKTPPLRGFFPAAYRMEDLQPCPEGTDIQNPAAYPGVAAVNLCYMQRVMPLLVAAAIHTKDTRYLDSLWESIEAVKRVSVPIGNGLAAPDDLNQHGRYIPEHADWFRPRYSLEKILNLLHAYKGFAHFGQKERADEALALADKFMQVLFRIQAPNGCLYGMYRFPSMEVSHPEMAGLGIEGYGLMYLRRYAEILRGLGRGPAAAKVEGFIQNCVRYLEEIDFTTTFGGESVLHTPVQWGNIALLCLAASLSSERRPDRERYRRMAADALKVSVLLSAMYTDVPESYFFSGDILSVYMADRGGYPILPLGNGEVQDFSKALVGMIAAEYLDAPYARLLVDYSYAQRLAVAVMDNGAISNGWWRMPGYSYVRRGIASLNNFAGVGIVAYYRLTGTFL